MADKITRRQLAALAASTALLAQAPAPVPPLPGNPEEELKAARDLRSQYADQLSKVEVPMSTEPAVHFKA